MAAVWSIYRPPRGDRPELFDAVAADGDVPVVEVDGRVAMAGDEADLVADLQAVGGAGDAEAAVLVGGAFGGGGGFVADERRARGEGEGLQAGVDDGAVLGRAAHYRRPHEKARLEGLGRGAVAVEVAAVIGVHEDVGAALQFGVDAARRFELEGAGAGAGDARTFDAVARQEVAGPPGLVGGLRDRLAALLPAAQMLRRAVIGLQSAKGEVRRLRDLPREGERRLARLDAAAVAAHVDFDIDRQGDPGLSGRFVERADLARIVGAHADAGGMCERGEAPQFLAPDHLVRDQHVRDPALDHRLGL